MSVVYSNIKIHNHQAKEIAKSLYNLEVDVSELSGELDFNFLIETRTDSYVLKISRPDEDVEYLNYQQVILQFISKRKLNSQKYFPDVHGNLISSFQDTSGKTRLVRLLSWIDGRLWSSVNPIKDDLLFSLGEEAGK